MRPHGKTKLGFFPLPVPEAERLKSCLVAGSEFSALDPCVGDGVAFTHLLEGTHASRYGIEIDAYRAEQARNLGVDTLQASAFDVRSQRKHSPCFTSTLRTTLKSAAQIIRGWNWYFWNTRIACSSPAAVWYLSSHNPSC